MYCLGLISFSLTVNRVRSILIFYFDILYLFLITFSKCLTQNDFTNGL